MNAVQHWWTRLFIPVRLAHAAMAQREASESTVIQEFILVFIDYTIIVVSEMELLDSYSYLWWKTPDLVCVHNLVPLFLKFPFFSVVSFIPWLFIMSDVVRLKSFESLTGFPMRKYRIMLIPVKENVENGLLAYQLTPRKRHRSCLDRNNDEADGWNCGTCDGFKRSKECTSQARFHLFSF